MITIAKILNLRNILIVSVICLALSLGLCLHKLSNKEAVISGYAQKEAAYQYELKKFKDKDSLNHATTKALSSELKVLKEIIPNELESIKAEIKGLKLKNLKTHTKTILEYKDSVVFTFKDSTITFQECISDSLNQTCVTIDSDKLILTDKHIVPVNITAYYKLKDKRYFFDLLRKKELVVEAKSLNPKVDIINLNHLDVKPRKKFLGIF